MKTLILTICLAIASGAFGAEFHVAISGNDANDGSESRPFRTISAAADVAMPGDVITVHAGTYRERVSPPRGGESDARRITYRAATGEQVVITGSERVTGWERIGGDTWKVTIPNKFFAGFNPYRDVIHGDWFAPNGRTHHTGCVYLDGEWMTEARYLDEVLQPAGESPLWFARVDGADVGEYLLNLASITIGQQRIGADTFGAKGGELRTAPCSEGGQCIGWVRAGDWVKFDKVNFGAGTEKIEFRAASPTGCAEIEVRLGEADGELLGSCVVDDTGDWQRWATFTATLKPTRGEQTVCLVFRPQRATTDNTTIWAQFPGVNPNETGVEINVRPTVFTPEKTGINFITLRGFTLRNAATNWAPPSAAQIGLVTAYWCKGWIIEDNDIAYSKCSGVALGKYGDEFDNTNAAGTADPYTECVRRALANGWNKAGVGSHLVRNNHIHHCEQAGVVGSMGCAFSTVSGNDIHDIHVRQLFGGAEMAGIKFHGAIDVVISGNHIHGCGPVAGIWLDWMGQGAQVTSNLLHENQSADIFCEMQHGPLVIANNLLLSRNQSLWINSKGLAVAHNLIAGPIGHTRFDERNTPFHRAHSTEIAGLHDAPGGDHRFFNNLFVTSGGLRSIDDSMLPCIAAGNVFTKGTQPSRFDSDALLRGDFDPAPRLQQKPDGWYLTISQESGWRNAAIRKLVTTDVLGRAKVPDVPYDNPDGTPIRITTDYFGRQRDTANPFPGPFEAPEQGEWTIKVWPRP